MQPSPQRPGSTQRGPTSRARSSSVATSWRSEMLRNAGAVLGGFVAWAVAATLINLALRLSWPAYAAVEKQLDFTLLMLIARLILGALASLAPGFTTGWISRRKPIAAWVLVILLLAIFIPVHI